MFNKFTILLTLLLFSFLYVNAQNIHEDYWDGEIYFKIKNNSTLVIEDLNHLNRDYKELASIFNRYNTNSIDRPFKVLKTPIFDRTYKVKFLEFAGVERLIKELEEISFIIE